jgi:hypothetical protein
MSSILTPKDPAFSNELGKCSSENTFSTKQDNLKFRFFLDYSVFEIKGDLHYKIGLPMALKKRLSVM